MSSGEANALDKGNSGQTQETVLDAAFQTITNTTLAIINPGQVTDRKVIWMEAELAVAKKPATRTSREKSLARMVTVAKAMRTAIKGQLVKSPEEAENLSDVLLFVSDIDVPSVLRYLKPQKFHDVAVRALEPLELTNVIPIYDELRQELSTSRGTENIETFVAPISLATIISVADRLRIDLRFPISEIDVDFIQANVAERSSRVTHLRLHDQFGQIVPSYQRIQVASYRPVPGDGINRRGDEPEMDAIEDASF